MRQQHVDDGQVAVVRRDVQQRPFIRLRPRLQLIRVVAEQPAQAVDITLPGSVEQLALDSQRIDARPESPPARKSVQFGEIELRLRQLCAGDRRS